MANNIDNLRNEVPDILFCTALQHYVETVLSLSTSKIKFVSAPDESLAMDSDNSGPFGFNIRNGLW